MIKQYILIRTDRKFPIGKIMAHIGHNVLEAYFNIDMKKHYRGTWMTYNSWRKRYNQTKIILDGGSKENIENVIKKAKRFEIPTSFIEDVHIKEKIVCVIGPLPEAYSKLLVLDKFKLYKVK